MGIALYAMPNALHKSVISAPPGNVARIKETTKTTKRDRIKDLGFRFFIKYRVRPGFVPTNA
jgi:hypothetical protein